MSSITQTEAKNNNNAEASSLSPEEMMLLQELKGMPKYVQPESFEQKLYRKVRLKTSYPGIGLNINHCNTHFSFSFSQFSKEPLVPIGCLTTAYFLGSGIKSFYNRDAVKSQKMMRLRVGAQFMTLMFLMGYAGMNAINFTIAPGYHGNNRDDKDKR